MNRTLAIAVAGLGLFALSSAALAGEWKTLPVMDADYKADLTVSAVGGQMKPNGATAGGYAGIEAAFNCLGLQPPAGVIRSKISYGEFNHAGLKLTSFEVNPRWTTKLSDNLSFGIGPGIGYVSGQTAGVRANMFAWQVGADVDYRLGALNLGLGVRWQGTQNKQVIAGRNGADNTLIQAKVGFNF